MKDRLYKVQSTKVGPLLKKEPEQGGKFPVVNGLKKEFHSPGPLVVSRVRLE